MRDIFSKLHSPEHIPLSMIIVSLCLVFVIIGGGIWLLASKPASQSPQNQLATTPNAAASADRSPLSPLLFGSNLSLANAQDDALSSPAALVQLQQLHIRILRLTIQPPAITTEVARTAQHLKALGITPLIVLPGMAEKNSLTMATDLVNSMNVIFGSSTVYYEYGNEDDLLGMSATQYVSAWNSTIPQLKRLALHGQFLGPASFQFNPDALKTFLTQAKPLPDAVSWHEYTCDHSQNGTLCIAHIDDWADHIAQARTLMITTLHHVLPIMITEWNYAADAQPNDGKSNDQTFMTTWTRQALQTLAANRVFASMQYALTSTPTSLLDNHAQMTAQGIVFQQTYQQFIGENAKAPGATSTATTTSAPGTSLPTALAGTTATSISTTSTSTASTNSPTPLVRPTAITGPSGMPTATRPAAPTTAPTATPTPVPAVQHVTVTDNLNDLSKTYSYSSNVTICTDEVEHVGNDTGRACRYGNTHEYVIWKLQNMSSFQAVTYFWSYEAISPYSVYTSSDGSNWTSVSPSTSETDANWDKIVYTLSNMSHVSYVKMVWNNMSGHDWSPQIGSVTFSS